ncbi:hypothetical protein SOVF_146040 isoform A [Spinacia oleracea]|nr:hypothetical protein SOVF_146040 isoform A [Spinacia oleracea]
MYSSASDPDATQAYVYALCPDMTTVAPNSRYQENINTVLSYLSSNSGRAKRFYNTSAGSGHDKVYGLFFCRLDVNDAACKKCVSLGSGALPTRCPGKKESTVWFYDQCVLHYSNRSFLGTMHDAPMIPMWNRQNALDIWKVTSNMTGFTRVLLDTMWEATINATSGRIDRKFATKEARFGGNLSNLNTLYTLVECTPDISLKDCRSCLRMVIGNTTELCNVKAGCTLMCPNCNMRYDIYPFYGTAAPGSSGLTFDPTRGTHAKATRRQRAILISTIIAAILALAIFLGALIFVCKRKSKKAHTGLDDIEGHYSAKSDVYSFGILVLEIVSGQLNNFFRLDGNEESLLDRAWRLWEEGFAMKLVDSRMEDDISMEEAEKCIHIGLLCIQEDASRRPRMATVVAALGGDAVVLPPPTAPHFFIGGSCSGFDDSSGMDLSLSAFTATSSTTDLDPR